MLALHGHRVSGFALGAGNGPVVALPCDVFQVDFAFGFQPTTFLPPDVVNAATHWTNSSGGVSLRMVNRGAFPITLPSGTGIVGAQVLGPAPGCTPPIVLTPPPACPPGETWDAVSRQCLAAIRSPAPPINTTNPVPAPSSSSTGAALLGVGVGVLLIGGIGYMMMMK